MVRRPDGAEVWRLRHGLIFSAVLAPFALAPGEAVEFPWEWDQRDNQNRPVPPGTYLVHGVLYSDGPDRVTEAQELVITDEQAKK